MATWPGWAAEFLLAARIINTPPNIQWLDDWAAHASSPQCRDNPIDLHVKVGGSTNCDHPAGFTAWTQAYTSHGHAATAFAEQVNSNQFLAILNTLGSGNPFQDPEWKLVVAALKKWPSVNFAAWFEGQMGGGSSGGGGGGSGIAPSTHRAWHDLQKSINKVTPAAIRDSKMIRRQTLRDVRKVRRVGR